MLEEAISSRRPAGGPQRRNSRPISVDAPHPQPEATSPTSPAHGALPAPGELEARARSRIAAELSTARRLPEDSESAEDRQRPRSIAARRASPARHRRAGAAATRQGGVRNWPASGLIGGLKGEPRGIGGGRIASCRSRGWPTVPHRLDWSAPAFQRLARVAARGTRRRTERP